MEKYRFGKDVRTGLFLSAPMKDFDNHFHFSGLTLFSLHTSIFTNRLSAYASYT